MRSVGLARVVKQQPGHSAFTEKDEGQQRLSLRRGRVSVIVFAFCVSRVFS